MPRPRPNLRPLRWPALLLTAAILILSISTIWRTTGLIYSSWAIGVQSGAFSYEHFSASLGLASFPTKLVFTPADTSDWHWWFQSTFTSDYTELVLPLWLPLLLTAIPTFLSWRTHLRHRRQTRLNTCPSCHYPLTGLPPTSPCPECGRAHP